MTPVLRAAERSLKRVLAGVLRMMFRSRGRPLPADFAPERILVIRQHNQLGDMLCAVPLLRALRLAFPRSHLCLMAGPGNRDVMMHCRYVDELLTYDKSALIGRRGLRPAGLHRLWKELRSKRFDLVLVPSTVSTSFTSDALAWMTGARIRIGAKSIDGVENPSSFFFTHPVALDWRETPRRHQTLRNLDIAARVTAPSSDLSHEMGLQPSEVEDGRRALDALRGSHRHSFAFHAGAGKPPNRWPLERFAALIDRVAFDYDAQILLTSGPMDDEITGALQEALSTEVQVLQNVAIRRVASILRHATIVVSNDTGIMHVAAAVGTPVLSIFGPTDPHQWAPMGPGFRYIMSESGNIADIQIEEVERAFRDMLSSMGIRPGPGEARMDDGRERA